MWLNGPPFGAVLELHIFTAIKTIYLKFFGVLRQVVNCA